jgi:hypothetical protein
MNVILKCTEKDTENGNSYWVKTTEQGIEITTQFKSKATVIKEGAEIKVAGSWWEAIRTNKKIGTYLD